MIRDGPFWFRYRAIAAQTPAMKPSKTASWIAMVVMTEPMCRAPIDASLRQRGGPGADNVRGRTVKGGSGT